MSVEELEVRLKAVERLTELFRLERLIYLAVTVLSLCILIVSFVALLRRDQAGSAELTLMFGSSGLITYSASRLLHMWTQALRIVGPKAGGER